MTSCLLRTSDIAKDLGVHPNTIRLYEEWGYFSTIPRGQNGYRQFSPLHLEQARLVRLALTWPFLGDRDILIELVKCAARGELATAMELAHQHLAYLHVEIASTEAAIGFLESWATGQVTETSRPPMYIKEAAQYLNVTVDMLRNWERSGLLTVPRDPLNGYRLYGSNECGRLRVIRTLVQSGYSLMAILRMLQQFDMGSTQNLRDALEIPREESDVEYIEIAADRWLSSLLNFEQQALKIILQIERLKEVSLL
ncbi:MerR family transcriptional regulator [Ktedonosporobacter rubrisoli]|uniref:MerR family transcriptional regulator n=1 Tax=Ktedonosporobacter rubrisoli TaxID=2509675 RepID=A0A4P6JP73_KTERU|nr:MerR family transcriptional regulator [Ktedonosporobacter rubrisoli]QBD77157.1 MerR family transcriptional regulator [Ktedonosporobacter rubrisoli]